MSLFSETIMQIKGDISLTHWTQAISDHYNIVVWPKVTWQLVVIQAQFSLQWSFFNN